MKTKIDFGTKCDMFETADNIVTLKTNHTNSVYAVTHDDLTQYVVVSLHQIVVYSDKEEAFAAFDAVNVVEKNSYSVGHIDGDASYNIDGNSYDEFGLYENDSLVATLKVVYESDDKHETLTLKVHDRFNAVLVPKIIGPSHLIASMMKTILSAFGEDHSFYCESFYEDDGHEVRKVRHALKIVDLS